MDTTLILVTSGCWEGRVAQKENKVAAIDTNTLNNKSISMYFYYSLLFCKTFPCTHEQHTRNFYMFVVNCFLLILKLPVVSSAYFYSISKHTPYHKLKYHPYNYLIPTVLVKLRPISSLNRLLQSSNDLPGHQEQREDI